MNRAGREIGSFLHDVGEYLDARALLPPASAVVVGVSGGADSVALLAALRRLADEPGRRYRLTAAHLNHGLRPEAGADADFVTALAGRWAVPCVVARRDVPAEARAAGAGVEQAARQARYEFLRQTAEQAGASHVAVAHHAGDQAETVLYRIIRGTHLRGLAGMPASRPLGRSDIVLVRPFLERTRQEIEDFCRSEGLSWRTDATNQDTAYRRNFIRRELLPLLRDRLNRRAEEALLRLAEAAAGAEEVLVGLARAALEGARLPSGSSGSPRGVRLDPAILSGEHPLVQTVALRIVLEEAGVPLRSLDADRLAEVQQMLAGAGPTGLMLPGAWIARMREGSLCVEPGAGASSSATSSEAAPEVVILECPGRTQLPDGREVLCRLEPFDPEAFRRHCRSRPTGKEILDADQVRGRLLCRPRRAGDRFVPLGGPGRQSVSDFLTNLKTPSARRDDVRCICDELGIVYLAPLRIDDRVKVTERTRDCLRVAIAGEPRHGQSG